MKSNHYFAIILIAMYLLWQFGMFFYLIIFAVAAFFFLNHRDPTKIQFIKDKINDTSQRKVTYRNEKITIEQLFKANKEILRNLGIFFAGFCVFIYITPPQYAVAMPFLICGFLFSIGHLRSAKKARMFEDIATSKMRSVAMGLVEVKGNVESIDEIFIDPIFGKSCVYYSINISKRKRKNRWSTIHAETKSGSFLLSDDTGSVLIPGSLIPNIGKHYFQRKDEDRRFLEFEGLDEKDFIKLDYDIKPALFSKKLPIPIKEYFDKLEIKYSKSDIRCSIKYIEPSDSFYVMGTARPLNDNEQVYNTKVSVAMEASNENRFTISDYSEKELIRIAKRGSLIRLLMIITFFIIGSIILLADIKVS
tara:strand:- start:149 stop:1237 length:1089 start_codon:yes stop_codon:yes gene_type:complete